MGTIRPKKKQVHYQDEINVKGSINIKTWDSETNKNEDGISNYGSSITVTHPLLDPKHE